jgi:predicted MFS family arabinose efflux permease
MASHPADYSPPGLRGFLVELASPFLGIFAIGTNLFVVVPLLPAIRQEFPVASVSDLGQLLVSAYALPYALLAAVLGPASDRVGRVPAMAVGLAALGLSALLAALAPSPLALALARATAGTGAALFTPAAYALVGDRYAYAGRERAMAIVLAGLPMSTLVGVPAAGLLAAAGSWRWGIGFPAALAVLDLLSLPLLQSPPRRRQTGYWSLIAATLKDGGALVPVAVSFLWFVSGLGLFTYMGQYLYSVFGFGPRPRALAVGAYGAMGLVGALAGTRLARRTGKRATILLGLTGLLVVFLLVAVNRTSGFLALLTLAAWGASSWLGMPSQMAIISELRPMARGTLLALNNSAMYLGATVGATVMGVAIERGGFVGAGALAAAVVMTAGLITKLWVRERATE